MRTALPYLRKHIDDIRHAANEYEIFISIAGQMWRLDMHFIHARRLRVRLFGLLFHDIIDSNSGRGGDEFTMCNVALYCRYDQRGGQNFVLITHDADSAAILHQRQSCHARRKSSVTVDTAPKIKRLRVITRHRQSK